jgi:PrsW family intramembrane metalloprotease
VAGLISSAILLSAFLVPVLYLLFLYEAQIYRDEPARVLSTVLGGGIILGIVATAVINKWVISDRPTFAPLATTTTLVIVTVVVPVIIEIIKPIPALMLRNRPALRETADGLVLGVAAGLGYSIAMTLVNYWSVLQNLPFHTDPAQWVYQLLSIGVFLPLLQGSATGLIVAGIWRFDRPNAPRWAAGAVAVALGAHIGFNLVSQKLLDNGLPQGVVLAWQGFVVAVLLLAIRYVLHYALLEEAKDLGLSSAVCPSCHRQAMVAGFCPACGKALTASPGPSRDARAASLESAATQSTEA